VSLRPLELLDVAKDVAQKSSSEGHRRCAISRAYYCAFHTLQEVVAVLPEEKPSEHPYIGHRETYRRLKAWRPEDASLKPLAHAAKLVSKYYKAALDMRENADYRLNLDISQSHVEEQLRNLEELAHFAKRVAKAQTEEA
jgi:uncharacterized protein (UPF0332 family)